MLFVPLFVLLFVLLLLATHTGELCVCMLCVVCDMHVHVYASLCDHASFDGDISTVRVQRTHPVFSQVPPDLYPDGYPHHEGTVLKGEDGERTCETSHQSEHAIIHTPLVK